MSELINVGICLSDIPKERIKRAENGKAYVNIVVSERRDPDQYGNTHTIYMYQTKEERDAKANRSYIGQGKAVVFNSTSTPEKIETLPPIDQFEDLPF